MSSPARRHFEKTAAALLAAEGSDDTRPLQNANQYELMLAKLAEDRRRLSEIQSMEKKAELKATLIADYQPWLQGVIAGNSGVQDDVLMTLMVWAIDARQIDLAIELATYAITHKLKMPDQYKRDTVVVVAEELSDIWLKNFAAGDPVDVRHVQAAMQLTAGADMPDEVRAKLYKVLGYALFNPTLVPAYIPTDLERLTLSLKSLQAALTLHDKVGVKKDIEKLQREIKHLAAT